MIIQFHPLYMRRLADIYLKKYGMLGYEEAKAWYSTFLDDGLRSKIAPYIRQLAEERDLQVD